MGLYALPVSLLLFGVIILVESMRKKTGCYIDFLLPVNTMFIVLFCVIPPYLFFADHSELSSSGYWIYKNPFESVLFLFASLVALAGYLTLIFGYYFREIVYAQRKTGSNNHAMPRLSEERFVINKTYLLLIGFFLGGVGSLALFFYAYSIGGVGNMIQLAAAFRDIDVPVISRWAFLKNLAPMVIASSYIFFALGQSTQANTARHISRIMFITMFLLSLLILWHQSGRLQLFAYFFIFPLSFMIRNDRINFKVLISGGIIFLFLTVFGKSIFHFFIHPESVLEKMTEVSLNPVLSLKSMLLEFSFPYIVLANTIHVVPTDIMYRWFLDIPLSIIYLLPERLLGLYDLPPTLTIINDELFNAPVPVDLVSFSYFSMGLAGVVITCFFYGILMRYFDRVMSAQGQPIFCIYRAAWIMFFMFNIMYGNPHHAIVAGFPLISSSLLLYFAMKCTKSYQKF